MRWNFAMEKAGFSTELLRFQPAPTPELGWFRQAKMSDPAYGRIPLGQWWTSPTTILRGWYPREIPNRSTGRMGFPVVLRALGGALMAAADRVFEWQDRARSRHMLLSLDDRLLRDIGIDRATAQEEGGAPFWRIRS